MTYRPVNWDPISNEPFNPDRGRFDPTRIPREDERAQAYRGADTPAAKLGEASVSTTPKTFLGQMSYGMFLHNQQLEELRQYVEDLADRLYGQQPKNTEKCLSDESLCAASELSLCLRSQADVIERLRDQIFRLGELV